MLPPLPCRFYSTAADLVLPSSTEMREKREALRSPEMLAITHSPFCEMSNFSLCHTHRFQDSVLTIFIDFTGIVNDVSKLKILYFNITFLKQNIF